MNKQTVTKRIIQAVAIAVGLLGLMFIFMGLYAAVADLREPDHLFTLCMVAMFLVIGGIDVAIAWQNLRRFGATSIKNVTALVVLLVWGGLLRLLEPLEEAAMDLEMHLLHSAMYLVPLILAYLLYRFLSRKLIQLAEVESSQQAETTVLSKAQAEKASDAP